MLLMNGYRMNELNSKIQRKRCEMIQHAESYGFTNEITLRSSQELDELINDYLYLDNQVNLEIGHKLKQMALMIRKPFNSKYSAGNQSEDSWGHRSIHVH
jgi:stage 0 sporulation regulatory protein